MRTRRCSICGETAHDKRTCPNKEEVSLITYIILLKDEIEQVKSLVNHILTHKHSADSILILAEQDSTPSAFFDFYDNPQIRIEPYTFSGDFSEMRNYATDLCDSAWVFQIDADELPSQTLVGEIHTLIETIEKEHSEVEVLRVPRINHITGLTKEIIEKYSMEAHLTPEHWFHWPDFQPRIYRTTPNIKWIFPIHETIAAKLSSSKIIHILCKSCDEVLKPNLGQVEILTCSCATLQVEGHPNYLNILGDYENYDIFPDESPEISPDGDTQLQSENNSQKFDRLHAPYLLLGKPPIDYWISGTPEQSIYHPKTAQEWIQKEHFWAENWESCPPHPHHAEFHQIPIPQTSPKELQKKIKELGPFFHRITVHGIDTQTSNNQPRDLWASMQHSFTDIKGKRVLDIGCNAGFVSFELAKAGAEVLGVDNNQAQEYDQEYEQTLSDGTVELKSYPDWITQAEWIESELNTGAKFQRSNFYDLDESEPYDTIMFLGVYYHLSNPASALRKLNRLLKKGGELYLESETDPTDSHYYEGDEIYKGDPSVYLVPTPSDINISLAHNGFKIVETFDTHNLGGPRYAVRAVKTGDRHSRAL
jgi:SAM-dependent methyltransferase